MSKNYIKLFFYLYTSFIFQYWKEIQLLENKTFTTVRIPKMIR